MIYMFTQNVKISNALTPQFTKEEKWAVSQADWSGSQLLKGICRDIKKLEVNQKFYERSVEHPTQMKLEALFEVALSASVIAATIIGCYLRVTYLPPFGAGIATGIVIGGWLISVALGAIYDSRWDGGCGAKGENYAYPLYIPIVGPIVALWKGFVTNFEAKRNRNLTSLGDKCMKDCSSEMNENFKRLLTVLGKRAVENNELNRTNLRNNIASLRVEWKKGEGIFDVEVVRAFDQLKKALDRKAGECDATLSAKKKLEKLFYAFQPPAKE